MVTKHSTKAQGEGSRTLEFASFSDIEGPYMKIVRDTIADILTLSCADAQKIMEANPDDTVEVCQALMEGIRAHGTNNRE